MKKTNDQVWVRWFYISNWSGIKAMNRDTLEADIRKSCILYSKDFWKDAEFEIIDGNSVRIIPAREILS
jgi:hypothetical protein